MIDFVLFFGIYVALGLVCFPVFARGRAFTRVERSYAILALFYRAVLTWAYCEYSLRTSADARVYYGTASMGRFPLSHLLTPGTDFVTAFTTLLYPCVAGAKNGYLLMYIPFSLLAYVGSLYLYAALRTAAPSPAHRRMVLLCTFFLPNLVFWTSNLGKDSLAFFGISLITYALLASKTVTRRVAFLVVGGAALFMVRPHVMLLFLASFGLGYLLQRNALSARNVVIFLGLLVVLLLSFNRVMEYTGIHGESDEEASTGQVVGHYYDAAMQRMNSGAQNLNTGGAATGKRTMRWSRAPLYMLEFIAGPFLWQARKPIQLLSAVENVIYQVMLIYLILNWRVLLRTKFLEFKYSWVLYILIVSTILGMTYTNFGLTVRQKCMVLPTLILLYLSVRAHKLARRQQRAAARAQAAAAQPSRVPDTQFGSAPLLSNA